MKAWISAAAVYWSTKWLILRNCLSWKKHERLTIWARCFMLSSESIITPRLRASSEALITQSERTSTGRLFCNFASWPTVASHRNSVLSGFNFSRCDIIQSDRSIMQLLNSDTVPVTQAGTQCLYNWVSSANEWGLTLCLAATSEMLDV